MKRLIPVCLLLLVAAPAVGEIGGASVVLLSPSVIVPGGTYTIQFMVQNASGDGEAITDVAVSFPDGFTLFPATMAYTPLVPDPLRPNWTQYVPPVDHTGRWDDADGGTGELFSAEGTDVRIDVTVAMELYGTPIFWCVWGDGTGAEPHHVCGCIDLEVSPVENASWSAIKAMYRG